jgi:hypothetical protein
LVRDTGTGIGFNKKVDIWSLGCIMFELCVGQKAFRHDFDTDDFASGKGGPLKIAIADSIDADMSPMYDDVIRQMLQPIHTARPGIGDICASFLEIVSKKWGKLAEPVQALSFIDPKNMLGTSLPSDEGLHCLRWELGLPFEEIAADTESNIRLWSVVEAARTRLLGKNHRNTLWIALCEGWDLLSIGRLNKAVEHFRELHGKLEAEFGQDNICTLAANYGLSWALTEAGQLGPADRQFRTIVRFGDHHNESIKRLAFAAESGLARSHLLWRPHEQTAEYLEVIVTRSISLLGENYPESLESSTLAAVAQLLRHDYAATMQARFRFQALSTAPTRLFGSEVPALLALCQLCWTFARNDNKKSEAIRIFNETVDLQRKGLDKDFPLTATSLEAITKVVNSGPIQWTVTRNVRMGNNAWGSRGTIKCENCRRAKKQVPPWSFPQCLTHFVVCIRQEPTQ